MALIEKLEAIGEAIRAKTGGTELLTLDAMPQEIESIETGGGGEYFTDEELTFSGNCSYLFAYDKWQTILDREKDRISIVNPNDLEGTFCCLTGTDYSFITVEGDGKTVCNATSLLAESPYIEKLPVFKNIVINANQCSGMFSYLIRLNKTDELIKFFDSITFNNSTFQTGVFFTNCYSLRNIDDVMPYIEKALVNYNSGFAYNNSFYYMTTLDEINNIPVLKGVRTYNGFNAAFQNCTRVKDITFATNDGVPLEAQCKSQTIDLSSISSPIGWIATYNKNYITNYNSGITADKEVNDDATYQALKDNPDWFATKVEYSRYNHDSAVNTINSLPDTSAYLAANGGTNTIKFYGYSGLNTDGGAINTLTEEEIAVATAKGWTVSLV